MKKFLVLFIMVLEVSINAQPYHFYEELGTHDSTTYELTTNIHRVNLENGEDQLFVEDIHYPNSFAYDNYQKWFVLNIPKGIYFYNPSNTVAVDSIFPNALEDYGTMAYSIDLLDYLYVGWVEPLYSEYGGISNTILLDINSLQMIKSNVHTYDRWCFLSKDNQFIYQYGFRDSLGIIYMSKYFIETDSLVEEINLNDLFPNIEYPAFDDGSHGYGLFGYNKIMSDSNTCKYITYDFDKGLFSPEISCPFRCYGHFVSNAKYFLLENVLWDESKPGAEYSSGLINIYETSTSNLIKTLTLPSDGKLLFYDSYPNDFWYVKNIEISEREIYKISFDSSSDELKVMKHFPNNY